MLPVNIINIVLSNKPEPFTTPINLKIQLEILRPLKGTIDWQVIYVGSADSSEYDQILGQINLNSEQQQEINFSWDLNAPDFQKIPSKEDLLGASALMISASYKNNEFFRCSYFVYNNIIDELAQNAENINISQVYRTFLTDKPRILTRDLNWDNLDQQDQIEKIQTDPQILQI